MHYVSVGLAICNINGWDRKRVFFFCSASQPDGFWGPPSGSNRLKCEANHSISSIAEAKNAWSRTSSLPACLQCVDRKNLTLYFCQMFTQLMNFETGYIFLYENNYPTTIAFRKISEALQMFLYCF